MRNKKALALTLGLGLAVGSLTMGTATIAHGNQMPAGMENMQMGHERPISMYDKANQQEMLTLLQIDEQTFKQEIDSGKSLREIGENHNISRQKIVNLLINNMNEQIDKRLADNRITVEQAYAMKSNVVDYAQKTVDGLPLGPTMGRDEMYGPEKHSPVRPMMNNKNHQEMLTLLQIDEQTFTQEKDSGKSLAQIAAAHNVSRQAVVDLVVKNMNRQIDQKLAADVAQANEMKANVVEKAQRMVDGQPMGQMGFYKMHNRPVSPEMLTLLQIDEQTFRQEQNNGKTLTQIAATHNVSRQAMVDLLVKEMNQHIDQGVADGRITAAQATEMKTNAVDKAQMMVDKNMMERPTQPQK